MGNNRPSLLFKIAKMVISVAVLLTGLANLGCRTVPKEQPMLVVDGVVYQDRGPILTDFIRVYASGRYEYNRCKLPRYRRMEFHGELPAKLVGELKDIARAITPFGGSVSARYTYPLEASHHGNPKPIEDLYSVVYAEVYANVR